MEFPTYPIIRPYDFSNASHTKRSHHNIIWLKYDDFKCEETQEKKIRRKPWIKFGTLLKLIFISNICIFIFFLPFFSYFLDKGFKPLFHIALISQPAAQYNFLPHLNQVCKMDQWTSLGTLPGWSR